MSLLLLTVTLRGVSNKHCLLSLFSFDFVAGSQLCTAVMELVVILDTTDGVDGANFYFMRSSLKSVINT